jgi:pSer/pThr/pTyr-binding forkhead associated (FHA) protein
MDTKQLAAIVEKLGVTARLHDLALFMREGDSLRVQRIQAVLDRLDRGVYLVGTGPYTQGVFSLMCEEVVIGRMATVLEKPLDRPVDVFVNDATTLTPREVSRIHCRIYRQPGVQNHDYWLIDRGSTCGTYLNNEKMEAPTSEEDDEIRRVSRALSNGDILSLGPSLINTFVFVNTHG